MKRVIAIARATFAEAIRHRILYLLVIFAVALIVFSRLLSLLTIGDDGKIIKDIGLTAINLFSLLIALFVGVGLLFREMERKTVQVTLAAPVARWEWVVGKYLGLASAISLNLVLMAVVLFGLLAIRGAFSAGLIVAVFLLWIEMLFFTAVAVFFSAFSTPILSALFTTALWAVGHLAWSLPMLEQRVAPGFAQTFIHLVYLVLPDLEYGDVRSLAVHGRPIPAARVVFAALYEVGYAVLLLVIACRAFRKRDLT